ncbi:MAG: hypothetical protein ABJE95_37505 [Byssovorax sp.]
MATGLFAIEVTTLLDADIPARRGTSVEEIVEDLKRDYGALVKAHGGGEPASGQEAFARLAAGAKKALAEGAAAGRDQPILRRIQDNARAIQDILAGWKPGEELPVDALLALRKMREIGTRQIAMQTVIHVDGDVITRIHPDHAGPAGRELVVIHQAAVLTSTRSWQSLIGTLGAFLEGVGRLFFGRSA